MKPRAAVDFGRHSEDYGRFRPGFPPSFFDRLAALVPLAGASVLDVGTGPGTVAVELARRGAHVMGTDVAAGQLAVARRRARAAGVAARCRFALGSAENTGFEDGEFDLVTAGQCWHWFDEQAALSELRRVLREGGALVVAYYNYLAAHSRVAKASEDLVLRHNPAWSMSGHSGLYGQHVERLLGGGFELAEQFCYDHDQAFTHESWRGRMRTCNGVGSGTLPDRVVAVFDQQLASWLRSEQVPSMFVVRHRVWATVVLKTRLKNEGGAEGRWGRLGAAKGAAAMSRR